MHEINLFKLVIFISYLHVKRLPVKCDVYKYETHFIWTAKSLNLVLFFKMELCIVTTES